MKAVQDKLQIFSAGVARAAVTAAIDSWNAGHPERPAELTVCGSVDLIRRVLSGEHCDVLIAADDRIIASMLVPDMTGGYVVFAGNRMVVAANNGYTINSESWREKLLDPAATFDHHDPHGDPGGYRSVMAMMLADKVESGLAEKLLSHPGHFGMEKPQPDEAQPEIMYTFEYYTVARGRGAAFAELPAVMNLSDEALADVYAEVSFAVDEQNTVTATPISHALTIPKNAPYDAEAKEFARLFLSGDFASYGFLPKRLLVGEDILR